MQWRQVLDQQRLCLDIAAVGLLGLDADSLSRHY